MFLSCVDGLDELLHVGVSQSASWRSWPNLSVTDLLNIGDCSFERLRCLLAVERCRLVVAVGAAPISSSRGVRVGFGCTYRKHWTSSSRSRPSACHAGVSFLVILTILVSSSSRSLINVALCETPPTLPSPESAPDSLSRFSFSRARSICSRISASRARRRETSDRILAWIAASKEACRSELGAPGAGGLLARWFTSDSPTCEMEVSAPCLPEVGCRARD